MSSISHDIQDKNSTKIPAILTDTTISPNTNTTILNADKIFGWEDLDICPELLRGIYSAGFEKPSPIQQVAILPLLTGRDVIAQAQSGTGKTACFAIGVLSRIDISLNELHAIVISPTRELSTQTKSVIDQLGNMMSGLCTMLVVGGTAINEMGRYTTAHVITGCPGRISDMIRRKKINVSKCRIVIFDEADELLTDGFRSQIYDIFQFLPTTTQIALFSATMPTEMNRITTKFLNNPVEVLVKSEKLTLDGIKQYYVALNNDDSKYETLKDIYGSLTVSQSIIYCNSIQRVQDLYNSMSNDNYPVCQIHSGMSSTERSKVYEEFKTGKHRVLISSNITARGIDIQQVSTVINFDVPSCVHTYLHRIGRSGRWGRKGVGINFIVQRDNDIIKSIERYYNTTINELTTDWAS